MSYTRSQQATGQVYFFPVPTDDIANLATGVVHLVESRIPVTEQHRCLIMPRNANYAGAPACASIRFAALNAPSPTIGEIVHGRMQLERPHDIVFVQGTTWPRKHCRLDWPGVETTSVPIHTGDDEGGPITRERVAKEVATVIYRFFKANPHIRVPLAYVRLLALSYYHHTWVPILALDC
ncbi:hypothetical protein D9615_002067 [Tricholomella constricta]|uniref:Uncharacterized protein n=1 Tax=Tricholomella constricta TaxID=117010 RepID=A0A8H5MA74_9AGAR|nr:hypothetical protein D9615_002067 [Tricholomella constricta]